MAELVAVSGSNITDATGAKLASGVIIFTPCNTAGAPISAQVGGGGQVLARPVMVTVTNGAFSAQLADTAQTQPANICYSVQVKATVGGPNLLGPGYLIQPTASGPYYANNAWSFDAFQPNLAGMALIQTGPQGKTGETGPANVLTIGTVGTGTAAASITGAAPAQVLNLTLPAGPSVPSLPYYVTTAAALDVVASGSYFLVPSASADGVYDFYQNNAGAASKLAMIPAALISSTLGHTLRLHDSNGFVYDISALVQSLLTQVTALEAEGLTVFSSTSAALAAGLAASAFFFVVSTNSDSAYDVYQNVNGAAVYVLTLPRKLVTSQTSNTIAVHDANGFSVVLVDSAGNVPLVANALAARDLQIAIQVLNSNCSNYSRGVLLKASLALAAPQWQYNYLPWYGQSLSTGYQTLAYLSTAAKYGNLMVGQYPIKSGNGQVPFGNTLFNPLKETTQASSGETECSGMANTAKRLLNNYKGVANDTSRTLVTNSLGAPGEPASLLTPTAPIASGGTWTGNFWSAVTNFMNDAAADAASASGGGSVVGTIGAAGFFYCQGENDYTDSTNGDPGLATYMANILAIRQAFDSACQGIFGQPAAAQAGMYTYQTGDQWTSDATGLAMQNAQWLMALTQPNWFMFGPHYPYPDLGGHLTANSYRWLGSMAGKVWHRTAVQRQGWQPLSPHKVTMFDTQTLLIGFHVPCPPLTVATAYNQSTACNYADLGFSLQDAAGYVTITVSIVADQVVQIKANRPIDWTTAILRYADMGGSGSGVNSVSHLGVGNLCDSDPALADDTYVASANQSGTADGTVYDFAGLVGNPYPLMNWCIAFQLRPYTFNTTGPTIG